MCYWRKQQYECSCGVPCIWMILFQDHVECGSPTLEDQGPNVNGMSVDGMARMICSLGDIHGDPVDWAYAESVANGLKEGQE